MHPLEYNFVLCVAFPIALCRAAAKREGKLRLLAYAAPTVLAVAAILASSRTAIVGLAVGFLLAAFSLPIRQRIALLSTGAAGVGVVLLFARGYSAAIIGLFLGVSSDPSAASRQNALPLVPSFFSDSPIVGKGFATFLPQSYIFDNAFILLLLEVGILGFMSFIGLCFAAIHSNLMTISRLAEEANPLRLQMKGLGAALCAGLITFAFFDGLSFQQSAGLLFVLLGVVAGTQNLHQRDVEIPVHSALKS